MADLLAPPDLSQRTLNEMKDQIVSDAREWADTLAGGAGHEGHQVAATALFVSVQKLERLIAP